MQARRRMERVRSGLCNGRDVNGPFGLMQGLRLLEDRKEAQVACDMLEPALRGKRMSSVTSVSRGGNRSNVRQKRDRLTIRGSTGLPSKGSKHASPFSVEEVCPSVNWIRAAACTHLWRGAQHRRNFIASHFSLLEKTSPTAHPTRSLSFLDPGLAQAAETRLPCDTPFGSNCSARFSR